MNKALEDRIVELEQKLRAKEDVEKLKAKYQRKGNAYWLKGVPYCIRCLEQGDEHTLINDNRFVGRAKCPTCGNLYPDVFPAENAPPVTPIVFDPDRPDPYQHM